MARRAAKVDGNHEEIVEALRAVGVSVQSLAQIGRGCPDILCSFAGSMYLMEIKRDKGKPNEMQKRWHIEWQAPVYVVRSASEALKVIGATA